MQQLEICFDFETCARTANAAVMSLGAVPWVRDTEAARPFLDIKEDGFFFTTFDLRHCVVDGFDFEQETINWWSRQSEDAKMALMTEKPVPVDVGIIKFFGWVKALAGHYGVSMENVYFWCQGTDFDASILRNICYKYDIEMPVKYYNLRDCRTYIKEASDLIRRSEGIMPFTHDDEKKFMREIMRRNLSDEELDNKQPHSALSDCRYSILRTWSLMCELHHGFTFSSEPEEP